MEYMKTPTPVGVFRVSIKPPIVKKRDHVTAIDKTFPFEGKVAKIFDF